MQEAYTLEAYCRKVPHVHTTSLLASDTRDADAGLFVRRFLSTALEIGLYLITIEEYI